jgi:hypothetical protein
MLVLDDLDQDERLGPVIGDVTPFYVEVDGAPYVILRASVARPTRRPTIWPSISPARSSAAGRVTGCG